MSSAADFQFVQDSDARKTPVRVAVVQEEARPAVQLHEEDTVMTFPHLVVRELIALVAASLVLVAVSILFDAPLEEIADPQKTPNPSKAPWYFLGLQELLHYYPPLVSGVILPGLVIVALAIIPYFEINLRREPFWEKGRRRKLMALGGVTLALCLIFAFTAAHPMWPVIIPTLLTAGLMALPAFKIEGGRWLHFLNTRSLAFWVFSWFLVCSVILTVIGTFFRGPGWAFTLPWRDGIY